MVVKSRCFSNLDSNLKGEKNASIQDGTGAGGMGGKWGQESKVTKEPAN